MNINHKISQGITRLDAMAACVPVQDLRLPADSTGLRPKGLPLLEQRFPGVGRETMECYRGTMGF